jgi:hypothetical protein
MAWKLPDADVIQVRQICTRLYENHMLGLHAEGLISLLVERLTSAVIDGIGHAKGSQIFWRDFFLQYSGEKAVVLHGGPIAAEGNGLHLAAKENDIKIFGFQHGVRREIGAWPLDVTILNENNFSDHLLCFNQQAVRYSQESVFAISTATAVGLPADYRRYRVRRTGTSGCPIIYVSTLLYRGNRQLTNTCLTDLQRANREIEFITNVLGRLPHNVRYKPYPSFRYADPDPVFEAAQNCKNIEIYTNEIDLRYIVGEHRVVVTTGATSTVGWCAFSDLPMVFIDDPQVQPLTSMASKLFDEGVFRFDRDSQKFIDEIRNFLSQPISLIESAAGERFKHRNALMSNLLGSADNNAGVMAYRHISSVA